jgi:hypothetical protein
MPQLMERPEAAQLLAGKSLSSFSQEDIDCLVNALALAKDYISKPDGKQKATRIMIDLMEYFAVDAGYQPQVNCSQCASFLPNYALYEQCMLTCTG